MSSEIMDVEALAAYLHIPRWSVYRLVASGRLPGAKVGRPWRFHKALVDEWLIANGRNNLISEPRTKPQRRAGAGGRKP
jgi:excisionase family DNA binding protein